MDNNANHSEYDFLKYYFLPDEYILWAGKSKGTDPFQKIFMVPFGVILLLFSSLVIVWGIIDEGNLGPLVTGVPFFGMSLYLIFGRALIVKNTIYVVTNYKIYRCRANKVDTLDMKKLPIVRAESRKDGTGTMYFGERTYVAGGKRAYGNDFSIEHVDNFAELQRIISDQTKNSNVANITEEE